MGAPVSVPLDFTVEFLLLVVALGAAIDAALGWRTGRGRRMLVQSAAFLVIALSQATLGLQLLQGDDQLLAGFGRGVGYLLLVVSVRPAALLPPSGTLVVVPPMLVGGPALLALVVAFRGFRSHRENLEPATFAFFVAFVALAIGELAGGLGEEAASAALIEHIARGLGALLLARWLTASLVRSIRGRFAAAFVAVLAVSILVIGSALNVVIGATIEREERERLGDAGRNRVSTLAVIEESAKQAAAFLARGLATPLDPSRSDQERQAEVDRVTPGLASLLPTGADLMIVVDPGGRALAALELVETTSGSTIEALSSARTIPLSGSETVLEVLADGNPTSGPLKVSYTTEQGRSVTELVLLGAAPVHAPESARETLGVFAVGYRIDREAIGQIAIDTGAVAGLVLGDLAVSARPEISEPPEIGAEPSAFEGALGTAIAEQSVAIEAALDERLTLTSDVQILEERYLAVFTPILRSDDVPLGMLVLATRADALAAAHRSLSQTLFLITLLTVVGSALLAWFGGRRITRPLISLTEASIALRGGDLGARAAISTADEVGVLGTAFNAMAADLEEATTDLRTSVATETALRGRLQAILRSMGDALVATDAEGVVTTINLAAEQMLGVDAEETVGMRFDALVRGTVDGGDPLAAAASRHEAGDGVLHGPRGIRHISFAAAPLRDIDDCVDGRVIVIRDVTETRQAARMKDEFLANVSHELRTPLTPIVGFAEMMTRREMPREKATEYLNRILESSQRLERVVDILVDFAAMEAGRMATRQEPILIRELLDAVVGDAVSRASTRTVRSRIARDVRAILADPNLVRRLLDELVDNAVKFSDGAIDVSATAERHRGRRVVRITVRDRGGGIAPDQLDELFAGFKQIDGSETREIGGLGLGLAFVKRAVEHLGGRVGVETQVGRGSLFSVVLPAAPTPGLKKATSADGRAARPAVKRPARSA